MMLRAWLTMLMSITHDVQSIIDDACYVIHDAPSMALLILGMNQKFATGNKCLTVGAWHCHAPTKIIPRISNAPSMADDAFYIVHDALSIAHH